MDPLGTVLGLVSMFSVCLEYFQYFKSVQSFSSDLELLILKLDIEHERMRAWGDANGILKTAGKRRNPGLDLPPTNDLIIRTLSSILSLFRDSKKLQELYGLQQMGGSYPEATNTKLLGTSGSRSSRKPYLRISRATGSRNKTSVLLKTRWAIYDKAKFTVLISDIKYLIDKLYQILPVPKVREKTVLKAIKSLLNGNQLRLLVPFRRVPAGRQERLGVKDESQNQDLVELSDREVKSKADKTMQSRPRNPIEFQIVLARS